MNVSPHQQRPAKYPWPGRASALPVVVAIVLVALIGFVLVFDPFRSPTTEPSAPAAPSAAELGL